MTRASGVGASFALRIRPIDSVTFFRTQRSELNDPNSTIRTQRSELNDPNSTIRIHAAAAHMIVLSVLTKETITAAINELQRTGELLHATRPVNGTHAFLQGVWVFNGAKATFPSCVFTSRETAEAWITEHKLEGTLTLYPLDQSAYDHAIANGWFNPQSPNQKLPEFIQRFTSASQEHYHYERHESK